jgi:hypothetical protein
VAVNLDSLTGLEFSAAAHEILAAATRPVTPARNARRLVGPGAKIVITIFQCLMIEALCVCERSASKIQSTPCDDALALAPGRNRVKAMLQLRTIVLGG